MIECADHHHLKFKDLCIDRIKKLLSDYKPSFFQEDLCPGSSYANSSTVKEQNESRAKVQTFTRTLQRLCSVSFTHILTV